MSSAPGDAGVAGFHRAVVDGAPEAIIVARPDGVVTYFNPAAERLFGYAAEAVVGRDITMLVPQQPNRRADPVRWLARWADEPQPEQARFLDFQARRADGSEMPVDVRVARADVAGEPRFVVTVRDNSARRTEQAALRSSNLRAARILLLADDAIVICDADQRITFINLSAERMFGYNAEDIAGRPLDILLPADLRAKHHGLVEEFGRGAAPSRLMSERQELRAQRRNGETFPIEATITKVSLNGALTYTAQVRDVSARKARESALAESERRFRAMFDHAAGALALLDPRGVVLEINRSARALAEGAEGLIARPLWELPWLGTAERPPDAPERGRLRDAVAAAAKGETVRYRVNLGQGDKAHHLDLILTPIRDGAGQVAYILPEAREIDPAVEG